jgi:hypothetical protein
MEECPGVRWGVGPAWHSLGRMEAVEWVSVSMAMLCVTRLIRTSCSLEDDISNDALNLPRHWLIITSK